MFLDELDAVLKQRSGAGQSHEEDNKVVAEFLNHLQETSEHYILFIGATNRLEALDDAGVRSGRIDKKVQIGKPDQLPEKRFSEHN
ncbi:AAA family ATPase [Halomicroarcula sp. GCM10025710]